MSDWRPNLAITVGRRLKCFIRPNHHTLPCSCYCGHNSSHRQSHPTIYILSETISYSYITTVHVLYFRGSSFAWHQQIAWKWIYINILQSGLIKKGWLRPLKTSGKRSWRKIAGKNMENCCRYIYIIILQWINYSVSCRSQSHMPTSVVGTADCEEDTTCTEDN